jgi:hypothetical protein
MLLDLSSSTPNTQGLSEEGIFVHKTLTKYGGVLELLGIKLFVPSGALTEDTLITLGVTWRFSVYPKFWFYKYYRRLTDNHRTQHRT